MFAGKVGDEGRTLEGSGGMRITSIEFVVGAVTPRQLPHDDLDEVAFLGRSNVGKSSLIGTLCRRKSLVRSSRTPGKTRELNYYIVNGQFYFVDLPGYGYAKVPEQVRASLGNLIEQYLRSRKNLSFVVQLVDSRHEPTELDLMMMGWLDYYEVPFLVALTKSDKLPRSKMSLYLKEARTVFSPFKCCEDIVMVSSVTGEGRTQVLNRVSQHLA